MEIKLKKINKDAITPTYGTEFSAGADLYACIGEGTRAIYPGQTEKINTGISAEIPEGYFGAIFARSGLATKKGLRPANAVGVVDADYRGEIIVALHNDSKATQVINDGDRIAQLVIMPFSHATFVESDKLSDTVRGEGGFGSTGNS